MEHSRRNHPLWQVNEEVSRIKIVVHGDILHDSKKGENQSFCTTLGEILSEQRNTLGELTVQPGSAGGFQSKPVV